jgi:predicted nucleic acid-binding Zn ribbon protein
MEKRCVQCGGHYKAVRRTRKYCSSACRWMAKYYKDQKNAAFLKTTSCQKD